jgi:ribulose-5-phosphate 4-epimerase/fuculose-1-phosphate aldolase
MLLTFFTVDPEWLPLHLAVYNARPDVNGVTTGHTPNARAFSVKGETLQMLWQDSCAFYNRLPVCPFAVAPNAANDPTAVADILGTEGDGLILQNRGLLSCSGTAEGAVGGYIRIDGLLGNQLLCEAAIKGRGGQVVPVGEEEILVGTKASP